MSKLGRSFLQNIQQHHGPEAMEPNPEVWPGETEHRWKTMGKTTKNLGELLETMENYGSFHVLLLLHFLFLFMFWCYF